LVTIVWPQQHFAQQYRARAGVWQYQSPLLAGRHRAIAGDPACAAGFWRCARSYSVCQEQIEAARLNGASLWRVFIDIVLPLCRTALWAGAAIAFVSALGNFGIPAMLGIPISYLFCRFRFTRRSPALARRC
jgi:iron(III) transport system permease protein